MPRPRTRPRRPRNREATRTAILAAAEAVFSELGFGKAGMSAIARRGRVTQSLIHHHFGTKQRLWDAVIRRRIAAYIESMAKLTERPAGDALRDTEVGVRALASLLRDNPVLVRLTAWTLAERESGPRTEGTGLIPQTVERLRQLQHAGLLRDDIDPASLFVMYFALVEYWFLAQPMLAGRFEHEMPSEQDYLDTVVKMLTRGAGPDGD